MITQLLNSWCIQHRVTKCVCVLCLCVRCILYNYVCDFVQFVSPCVGGSIVPPHTLYRIKCVLAVIYLGVKNKMVASTSCVKKTLARSLQHKTQTSLDTDRSRPTREGASRRPYAEAHAQVRPTALPAFQRFTLVGFSSGKRPAIVCCSHRVSEKHRERQKGSGELDESAPPSPQRIIAFFGDTNYINHAQIRYLLRDKPLALGSCALSRIHTYWP